MRTVVAALVSIVGCQPSINDAGVPTKAHLLDDVLRVNHVQVLGTHNSYHVLGEVDADQWRYEHRPLDEQLDRQGVRAFEIDTWFDEESGALDVFHIALVDAATTCATFDACLGKIASWSRAHRAHVPLSVQIEIKNDDAVENANDALLAVERDIAAAFDDDMILSPDLVRGDAATVNDALVDNGWPTLSVARGRTLFFIDTATSAAALVAASPTLASRLLFPRGPSAPGVQAIAKFDDPTTSENEIADAVNAGLLVRTRADSDGNEARADDLSRAHAAFSSGAHIVSTDFPAPFNGLDYFVQVPDGTPARCHPTTAPPACTSLDVEDPEILNASD